MSLPSLIIPGYFAAGDYYRELERSAGICDDADEILSLWVIVVSYHLLLYHLRNQSTIRDCRALTAGLPLGRFLVSEAEVETNTTTSLDCWLAPTPIFGGFKPWLHLL